MDIPFTIEELDNILENSIEATDNGIPEFWAVNISGRNHVKTADEDRVQDKLNWISANHPSIIVPLGIANDNLTYYKLGYKARAIMAKGGFKPYLKKLNRKEGINKIPKWMPLVTGFLALIISACSYFFPAYNKIKEVQKEIDQIKVEQQKLFDSLSVLKNQVGTVSAKTN